MSGRRGGIGVGGSVLLVFTLASLVVFGAMLGPRRAARIAIAAALSTAVDPIAGPMHIGRPGPHRIPVFDVDMDPAWLDTLNADLPWSGKRKVPAEVRHQGVVYRTKFRYRGALTPSHFLGDKKSFRVSYGKDRPPGLPYRRMNFINPKPMNMLNNHIGLWIGGLMGVPVPHDELVFVRLNGKDHGVMEMLEQPGGEFEEARGLHAGQVPIYRGDFGPVQDRRLGAIRFLWADADHWQYVGKADSTEARAKLEALVSVVRDTSLSPDARRDTLATLIDVDAFARYMAAMFVANTAHIDQMHNQFLVLSPRTGRFYPVLWDVLLMYPPPGEPLYHVHDALAHWMLRVPEWRLLRDRYAHEAIVRLHRGGLFQLHWRSVEDRLLPSLLADPNKFANVTFWPEDVHRFSVVHAAVSSHQMRRDVAAYWERALARLSANEVTVRRSGDALIVTSASEAPLRLTWREDGPPVMGVVVNGEPVPMQAVPGGRSVVLHRSIAQGGPVDHPLAEKQSYKMLPLEAEVRFIGGAPSSITVTNAITDEEVR